MFVHFVEELNTVLTTFYIINILENYGFLVHLILLFRNENIIEIVNSIHFV